MEMSKRDRDSVVVFDLQGELRGGPADDAPFEEQLPTVDGALQEVGGNLTMCEPNDRISHIFTTTRFDKVIGIYGSEDEAYSSFGS